MTSNSRQIHLSAKPVLFLIVLLGISHGVGFAQSLNAPAQESSLVQTFEYPISPGPIADELRRAGYKLMQQDIEKFAVRICSKENLLKSIPSSSASLTSIVDAIKSRYREPQKTPPILVVRSEDCVSNPRGGTNAIELWAIRKEGQMPTFVESVWLDKLNLTVFTTNDSPCSSIGRRFKDNIHNTIRRLRTEPSATVVIVGYYLSNEIKSKPTLEKRVRMLTNRLESAGLLSKQLKITREMWRDDETACPDRFLEFPSIFILRYTGKD